MDEKELLLSYWSFWGTQFYDTVTRADVSLEGTYEVLSVFVCPR